MGALFTRVKQGVTGTPGTGTIMLGAAVRDAVSGDCLTCAEVGVPDGTVVSYFLFDGPYFAEGEGAYDATANTLARDAAEKRWNGTSFAAGKLNLSAAAVVMLAPRVANFGASGVPALLADGVTASNVQAALDELKAELTAAPGLKLLGSATVSAPALRLYISNLITPDYEEYELHVFNLLPDLPNSVSLRLSANNNGTQISANYAYGMAYTNSTTKEFKAAAGASGIPLVFGNVENDAGTSGISGIIKLLLPPGQRPTVLFHMAAQQQSITTELMYSNGSGQLWDTSVTINAMSITFTGTDVVAGSWRLYGLKK